MKPADLILPTPPKPVPLAETVAGSPRQVKTTNCYMCACHCGIRVYLCNAEVCYIDGNPEQQINKGIGCAMSSSGVMRQRSPACLARGRCCAIPATSVAMTRSSRSLGNGCKRS